MNRLASTTLSKLHAAQQSKRFISNVAVIGSGLMGSGIAQVAAQTGHSVVLVDVSDKLLETAIDNIKVSLNRVAKKMYGSDAVGGQKFIAHTLANLKASTDAVEASKTSDVVVEAIVENLEVKQKLFETLDKSAPPHVIFASNTSSLSVQAIASKCSRKDKVGGMHFFNPVPVMQLVEVIRIPETSDATHQELLKFGKSLGKEPITCKDTPGFVVNRLLGPYVKEALKMLERGDATARDIDIAMKLGAGYPMGPFELLDYTGLDTNLFINKENMKLYPNDPAFYVSPLLEKLVSEGKLGRKSGEGFYKYKK